MKRRLSISTCFSSGVQSDGLHVKYLRNLQSSVKVITVLNLASNTRKFTQFILGFYEDIEESIINVLEN